MQNTKIEQFPLLHFSFSPITEVSTVSLLFAEVLLTVLSIWNAWSVLLPCWLGSPRFEDWTASFTVHNAPLVTPKVAGFIILCIWMTLLVCRLETEWLCGQRGAMSLSVKSAAHSFESKPVQKHRDRLIVAVSKSPT